MEEKKETPVIKLDVIDRLFIAKDHIGRTDLADLATFLVTGDTIYLRDMIPRQN